MHLYHAPTILLSYAIGLLPLVIAGDTQIVLDAQFYNTTAVLGVPSGAYPFQTKPEFLDISQFLGHFYLTDDWINTELMSKTYRDLVNSIGQPNLTPDSTEPVADTANPGWMVQEAWRALNAFQGVLSKSSFGQFSHTPVKSFLDGQGTTPLANALFPPSIKTLLKANEALIAGKPNFWVGRGAASTVPNVAAPLSGINVAYSGPKIGYYQRGSTGPLSIEAALILATQLAGINLNSIDRSELPNNVPWYWLGAMTVPPGKQPSGTLMYLKPGPTPTHPFGYNYKPTSLKPSGDPGAGFYLAFEIDFDLRNSKDANVRKNRNVFVFAVHAIDEHSRLEVADRMNLRSLTYTSYPPATRTDGPKPGETGQPPAGNTKGTNARFYGHAHAGYVKYDDLEKFLYQTSPTIEFPRYSQFGFLHMYILSENERVNQADTFWPRGVYKAGH